MKHLSSSSNTPHNNPSSRFLKYKGALIAVLGLLGSAQSSEAQDAREYALSIAQDKNAAYRARIDSILTTAVPVLTELQKLFPDIAYNPKKPEEFLIGVMDQIEKGDNPLSRARIDPQTIKEMQNGVWIRSLNTAIQAQGHSGIAIQTDDNGVPTNLDAVMADILSTKNNSKDEGAPWSLTKQGLALAASLLILYGVFRVGKNKGAREGVESVREELTTVKLSNNQEVANVPVRIAQALQDVPEKKWQSYIAGVHRGVEFDENGAITKLSILGPIDSATRTFIELGIGISLGKLEGEHIKSLIFKNGKITFLSTGQKSPLDTTVLGGLEILIATELTTPLGLKNMPNLERVSASNGQAPGDHRVREILGAPITRSVDSETGEPVGGSFGALNIRAENRDNIGYFMGELVWLGDQKDDTKYMRSTNTDNAGTDTLESWENKLGEGITWEGIITTDGANFIQINIDNGNPITINIRDNVIHELSWGGWQPSTQLEVRDGKIEKKRSEEKGETPAPPQWKIGIGLKLQSTDTLTSPIIVDGITYNASSVLALEGELVAREIFVHSDKVYEIQNGAAKESTDLEIRNATIEKKIIPEGNNLFTIHLKQGTGWQKIKHIKGQEMAERIKALPDGEISQLQFDGSGGLVSATLDYNGSGIDLLVSNKPVLGDLKVDKIKRIGIETVQGSGEINTTYISTDQAGAITDFRGLNTLKQLYAPLLARPLKFSDITSLERVYITARDGHRSMFKDIIGYNVSHELIADGSTTTLSSAEVITPENRGNYGYIQGQIVKLPTTIG